jgi:uncharacterized delta-60 repeat protein
VKRFFGARVFGPVLVAAVAVFASVAQPATAAPGAVDDTFGGSGSGALRTNLGGTYDWAYATALQPDGRILAAGVSNAGGTYDFALARYTSTHSLDPTFGTEGVVLTDFGKSTTGPTPSPSSPTARSWWAA